MSLGFRVGADCLSEVLSGKVSLESKLLVGSPLVLVTFFYQLCNVKQTCSTFLIN